jgi:hypothetical protein
MAAMIAALRQTIRQLNSNGSHQVRGRNMIGLKGYSLQTISEAEALPLILQHERLANLGNAQTFVGLVSPQRELHGVVAFGSGPAGDIRRRIGPALCLQRGCCVSHAPPNAASFLINNACKLVYRITGVDKFFAYSDPAVGEYGAVYQAAGWVYLGQGIDGPNRQRTRRYAVCPPNADPSDPSAWQSTRALRTAGRHLSFADARALGWRIASVEAKHVYATCVGRDRTQWQRGLGVRPPPAPRPELKLKRRAAKTERLAA